jgi:hypothetical protein
MKSLITVITVFLCFSSFASIADKEKLLDQAKSGANENMILADINKMYEQEIKKLETKVKKILKGKALKNFKSSAKSWSSYFAMERGFLKKEILLQRDKYGTSSSSSYGHKVRVILKARYEYLKSLSKDVY